MNTTPDFLHIEIRTSDRLTAGFYHPDENGLKGTLRFLTNPRIFLQPQLVIAGADRVTTIFSRTIDLIVAHTRMPLPKMFPLNSPAGFIHLREARDGRGDPLEMKGDARAPGSTPEATAWRTFLVDYRTIGGWRGTLEVQAQDRGTALDRRQTFGHYFQLPVIPFQLQTGGIGLINPANLASVSARPLPDAVPDTALHMEVTRLASDL